MTDPSFKEDTLPEFMERVPSLNLSGSNNLTLVAKLDQISEDFIDVIEDSKSGCLSLCYILTCCKCFRFACCRCSRFFKQSLTAYDNIIFGQLDQSRIIMERNFKGKQFFIPSVKGRSQPQIDCMFFPCTSSDVID